MTRILLAVKKMQKINKPLDNRGFLYYLCKQNY